MNTSKITPAKTILFNELLRGAGMRPETAEAKTGLFAQCLKFLESSQQSESDTMLHAAFVPGRIEFLGKHTDYAGGRSLVTAVDMGFCTVFRGRTDRTVRIRDIFRQRDCAFNLDALPAAEAHAWTVYPLTVAQRLVRNFPGALRGADIAFFSDLPAASGLSSSSAFMIAIYTVLATVNRLEEHPAYQANIGGPESLAGYLGTIENGQNFGSLIGERGVGTFGGSEDHTAILCSRPGCLVQYRYCPVVHERTIRLPDGTAFVVAVSGVKADKNSPETQRQYNLKSLLVTHMTKLWRESTEGAEPHLAAILESGPGALATLTDLIRQSPREPYDHDDLIKRLNQFHAENFEIVGPAGEALERGDLAALGALVDRSQRLSETWLMNQVPETIALAKTARELGAHAASAFGAGFGGAVWALVDAAVAASFQTNWQARYERDFPESAARADFRTCQPGPAAFSMPLDF